MEETGCVFPPAGPKQEMDGAGQTRQPHESSLPGEERKKGGQELFRREAQSQGKVDSSFLSPDYPRTVIAQGWQERPSRAKREFEVISVISMRKSLLLWHVASDTLMFFFPL